MTWTNGNIHHVFQSDALNVDFSLPCHPADQVYPLQGLYATFYTQDSLFRPQRIPFSSYTFFTVLLPPVVVYYFAVLLLVIDGSWDKGKVGEKVEKSVQGIYWESFRRSHSERLRLTRLALTPPTLLLAYRTATTLDLSGGHERMAYLNQALTLGMFVLSTRTLVWGCIHGPVKRIRPVTSSNVLLDAADLAFSLRGIGWIAPSSRTKANQQNDSYPTIFNTYIAPDPYSSPSPTSGSASLICTLSSFLIHLLIFDILQYTVQSLVFPFPSASVPLARTIYSPPPPHTFPHSALTLVPARLLPLLTTILSGFTIYTAILTVHTVLTLIGIHILRQTSYTWRPPAFDKPWLAESVADFWGRRWHQYFRVDFVGVGGGIVDSVIGFGEMSLSGIGWAGAGSDSTSGSGSDDKIKRGARFKSFKRILRVIAAFLVSGILHYVGLWGMYLDLESRVSDRVSDSDTESIFSFTSVFGTIGFFLLMGLGVILEGFWVAITGRKVRGWVGWAWTMVWVTGWGQFLVEAWARSGTIDSLFIKEEWRVLSWVFGERY